MTRSGEISQAGEFQRLINEWKTHAKSLYFGIFSSQSFGRLIPYLDNTYFKIKNLNQLVSDTFQSYKVKLNIPNDAKNKNKFKQYILPLTNKRIIVINYHLDKSMTLESYDAVTGNNLNSLFAYDQVSYFPLSCGYGDYFCVSFTDGSDLFG